MIDLKNQRKLGVIMSYIYIFVNAIMTFIYTPFLIKYLGKSEYGLYTIALSIMSYLSMLDLGFGNSMIRYTSKYKSLSKKEEEKEINGLFLIFYLIICLISLLIGAFLYKNVGLLFGQKFTADELNSARIIILILVVNVSIAFPLSVFGSYIISSEKFAFQKGLLIIKAILYPISLIYALLNGANAIVVVILMSVFSLAINLINAYYCIAKLNMRFKISKSCFKYFKEIFAYSFFIFLAMIVDSIYNNTDQIILGAVCGTAVVAVYGLFTQIRTMYEQMSTAISGVCLPKIVSMIERKKSDDEISNFFNKVSKIQMIVMFLVLFGFISFGKIFVILWGGADYVNAYYVALIILIPATIPLTQNTAISICQAKNKHKFRSVVYLFVAILNVIITIPLSKNFGAIGAAIGSSISLLLGNIIIINIYYYKTLNIDVITYFKNIIKITLITFTYSIIFKLILHFIKINITSLILLFVFCIIYSLGYLFIIYLLFFTKNDKKNLRQSIKKLIYKKYPKIFVKNYIIFESNPDMSDNSLAIYNYFLKQKLNNKYKLVWFVDDPKKFKNYNVKNVKFVKLFPQTLFGKIKTIYYNYSARLIIDCNKYVHKKHINQTRIHLLHGIGYKKVDEYLSQCGEADYFILPGNYFFEFLAKKFNNSVNKFRDLGFARNDALFKNINIKKKLNLQKNCKLILWLPTYRKHKNKNEINISDTLIPIYDNLEKLKKLNEYLIENNIYIYLKPHPAQDISSLIHEKLSNFKIILDSDLHDLGVNLYEFLSGTDSLITDYSSVYFDYLLKKNIIGVTLDDYDYYKKYLSCKNYDEIISGEHIYNEKDFMKYLKNLKNDNYDKKKYEEELKKYHTHLDGNSAKRLYEFIIKNILK